MKVYSITNPEQLEQALENVKWQNDEMKVRALVALWRGAAWKNPEKPFPVKVTLELGRQAFLFREKDGEKLPLATMYVNGAREYAKGLVEE